MNESIVEGIISLDKKDTKYEDKDFLLSKKYSAQDTIRMKTQQNDNRSRSKPKISDNKSNRSFEIQNYTHTDRYKTQVE